MDFVKNYFRDLKHSFKARTVGDFLVFAASVLMLIELILYLTSSRTSFDPNYSPSAIVGMAIALVCGIASIIAPLKALGFGVYLGSLFGLIHYVVSQINLIANIIYGVDGSTFPPAFFVTIVCAVLTTGLSLAGAILIKTDKRKERIEALKEAA